MWYFQQQTVQFPEGKSHIIPLLTMKSPFIVVKSPFSYGFPMVFQRVNPNRSTAIFTGWTAALLLNQPCRRTGLGRGCNGLQIDLKETNIWVDLDLDLDIDRQIDRQKLIHTQIQLDNYRQKQIDINRYRWIQIGIDIVEQRQRQRQSQKERETGRQRDRETERQIDRQTERQINRQTDRQIDRKIDGFDEIRLD